MMLRSLLKEYRQTLSLDQQEKYELLVSGQSFNGRRQMIRELQVFLGDFK